MHADTIHTAILSAYPDADPQRDYVLRDDGYGPYLDQWNIAGPIPAGASMKQPAITEWTEGAQRILDALRTIIRDARDLEAFFEDNPSIYAAILATPPGEIVPGTNKTREALILTGALMQDASKFFSDAVVGDPPHGIESPPTRRAVVMAR